MYQNDRNAQTFSSQKKTKPAVLNETNYVDLAEQAIKTLSERTDRNGRKINVVTTSKIRNLLAMVTDIYNDVAESNTQELTEELLGRINYFKIRMIYESGRDKDVDAFIKETCLLEHLKDIKKSRKQFIRFSRYMEALVAYHRYYGGKDM